MRKNRLFCKLYVMGWSLACASIEKVIIHRELRLTWRKFMELTSTRSGLGVYNIIVTLLLVPACLDCF